MAQNGSYPSPNSGQMGEAPFYTSQNQLPAPDDVHGGRPPPLNPNMHQFRHSQLPSPQQLAQSGLESAEGSSRKRTKVSRACDECRRKKIRCDAPSEDAGAQCSSCKRSDLMCQFSRQPQKRGPSKGYIKELASRVDALEGNQMQTTRYPYGTYEYSPQPDELGFVSKKRTHSMSEGLQPAAYMHEAQEPTREGSLGRYPHPPAVEWSGRDQVQNLLHALPNDKNIDRSDPSINYDTSAAQENYALLNTEDHPASYLGDDMAHSDMEITTTMTDRVSEWDEHAINEYYRVIHLTLPILPDTKTRLFQFLDKTSIGVRKAFEKTLHTLLPASGSSSSTEDFGMSAKGLVAELILTTKIETYLDHVVLLQAILLLIIIPNLRANKNYRPQGFYNIALWLVAVIEPGAKKSNRPDVNFTISSDKPDPAFSYVEMKASEEPARRAWVAFLVVESWGVAALHLKSQPLGKRHHLDPSDKALLKDTGFHIARLSLILGHINDAILDHKLYGANSASPPIEPYVVIFKSLNGQLERIREQMEPLFESLPHVHLAFLHVKLFLGRHHMTHFRTYYPLGQRSEIEEPVGVAIKIINKLRSSNLPLSPWTQHFSSLCRVVLLERSHRTFPGDVVPQALQELHSWYRAEDNPLASAPGATGESFNITGDRSITKQLATFANPTPRRNLQHLADAAVGNAGFDEQPPDDDAGKAS